MVGTTSTKTTGVQTATNILIPASASNDQPIRQPFFDCKGTFFCIMCFVVPYFILAPLALTLLLTRPREYDPEFLVHSAALQYPRNNTPSEFTAIWNLTLLAMNPNKKWDIYCDSLQASLFYYSPVYQRVLLAATSLRPLLLTTANQTLVVSNSPRSMLTWLMTWQTKSRMVTPQMCLCWRFWFATGIGLSRKT
ncbi:uncharacterized protein Pyn_25543 [Prunus yedoensis var. nudiflora]|uniref:Uncharacterized protein n=1 Tax=Prunus yedoensis var. nudiflora TaxID=2094558 RepID=A0A314Z0F6_PRUYE|nr:uncharacterized protein Pyn_25543 [Prunus yedoensis var. nudiflora]